MYLLFAFLLPSITAVPCVELILTGTSTPIAELGRAGPGNLIRIGDSENGCNEKVYQIDAGRGTAMSLQGVDIAAADLDGLFLTHIHSDHISDLYDIVQTRALLPWLDTPPPLRVITTEGGAFISEHLFGAFAPEIASRRLLNPLFNPEIEVISFTPSDEPQVIFQEDDLTVEAVLVPHLIDDASAFRFSTPFVSIVFSGDAIYGDNLRNLSTNADVVLGNVMYGGPVPPGFFPAVFPLMHLNSQDFGMMGAQLNTPVLIATHFMPAPGRDRLFPGLPSLPSPLREEDYVNNIRLGGFTNEIVIGRDLMRFRYTDLQIKDIVLVDTTKNTTMRSLRHGSSIKMNEMTEKHGIRVIIGRGEQFVDFVRFTINSEIRVDLLKDDLLFVFEWEIMRHFRTLNVVATAVMFQNGESFEGIPKVLSLHCE